MTSADALKTSLALMGSVYNRKIDGTVADAYWIALRDASAEQISQATARALRECKFFPAPSELRQFAGLSRNLAAEVALAWDAVRAAVTRHDYTVASIDFGARVNAVIRNLGGWDALCRAKTKELDVWLRKEFERVYIAFSEQGAETLNGHPLRGAGLTAEHVMVEIGGESSAPRLAARVTESQVSVRALVRGLVGETPKERSRPATVARAVGWARSVKPAAAPLTEAELAARKAEIAAQVEKYQREHPDVAPTREAVST